MKLTDQISNKVSDYSKEEDRFNSIVIRKISTSFKDSMGITKEIFIGNILTCYGVFSLLQNNDITKLEFLCKKKMYTLEFPGHLDDGQLQELCRDIFKQLFGNRHYNKFKDPEKI